MTTVEGRDVLQYLAWWWQ